MDARRFDSLTRHWATRRTAIGSLVFGLFGLTGLDAEAKRKRRKHRNKKRKHPGDHAGAEKTKQHAPVRVEKKKKRKKKCKGGAVKCGKVCVNASTDAQNCGGCGNPCGNGQACVGGVCTSTGPGPGPVACPTGQVRCGELCVDPASNESHCGGCGQTCQGELTCLGGTCGCADAGDTQCGTACVETFIDDDEHCGGCGQACQGDLTCLNGACSCSSGSLCGTACVDTQTNAGHCGQCGRACGAGQRCQGGQCVTITCGVNETLCGGTCVPSFGDHPCCSQFDCGPVGSANHIYCDESQHQCRCNNSNYGICLRTLDKRGLCNECCEGGIEGLNCQGEMGCHGQNFCTCPTGSAKCPGGDYRCYQNPGNPDGTLDDPTTCLDAGGNNCMDCTLGGTRPYVCCWGRTCVDTSGLGPNVGHSLGHMCGGCTKCPPDKACCNDGPGTAPKCKTPANGGFCPLPGED